MDVGTGLAIFSAKELLLKMIGPTADYLGSELKAFTEKRLENLTRIVNSAKSLLGNKINDDGSISPRVLREIMDHGTMCSESISIEYYGGLLASSRTGISRDDRAVPVIEIIKSLSVYQIRTHYVIYQIIRKSFIDSPLKITAECSKFKVYIPFDIYMQSMNFEENESKEVITQHAMLGLSQKGLITPEFKVGPLQYLHNSENGLNKKIISNPGIVVAGTACGAEVFLFANGHSDCSINDFVSSSVILNDLSQIEIKDGYSKMF